MIEPVDYHHQRKVYSRDGVGRWRILTFCPVPSVTMVDTDTEETEVFGVGGLTDKSFEAIGGLTYSHEDVCIKRHREE